jgi:tetratricopeptide (TPR) repeat protein
MKASIRRLLQPTVFMIALQLMLIASAAAQGTRGIKIYVTDDKDQPVANARVQILGIDVGRNFALKTDAKGECLQLLGNQPGTYRVVARQNGFQPGYNDRVSPEMDETVDVRLKLKSGQDYKLPWEMSEKEKAEYKKRYDSQKQNVRISSDVKALFDNGVKLAKDEKYDEAIEAFSKAIEKDPKQPYVLSNRANAYTKVKKYDEAVADYDKAIELAVERKLRDEPNFYFEKAVALSLNGKIEEADKLFQMAAEKAKDMNPADAAQFHLNRGIALKNNGITDKAIEAFRQAIVVDSRNAEAYYQLGVCLSAKPETFSEAIEHLKKYLQMGKRQDHIDIAKEMIKALGGK